MKNAAKLHFLFQTTKYLSKNSRDFPFFFHFVKSTCRLTRIIDMISHLIYYMRMQSYELLWTWQSIFPKN